MRTESLEFPRGGALPKQSPLYWVDQKNRYLRQLMIRDIEDITGRSMLVYYTDCNTNAQIDPNDDKYLLELLCGSQSKSVDLFLETNGGVTDATEKVVTILRAQAHDLRVIVPRRAKSNGTLMALAAKEIVMGPGSELGPIDPNLTIQGMSIPCQFIMQAQQVQQVDAFIFQAAQFAVMQTQKLAKHLLETGMLSEHQNTEIESVVNSLSTRNVYHSHGSVIDASEAKSLGLNVSILDGDDDLWRRFWLLRCMYEADARASGVIKIFESSRHSNSIQAA
jgi:hypothetical protein